MKLTSRGFTLVELMIVIAIIGILAAALFPALSGYLASSRDAGRAANLRNIQVAAAAYFTNNSTFSGLVAANNCLATGSLQSYMGNKVPMDSRTTAKFANCGIPSNFAAGTGTSNGSTEGFALYVNMESAGKGNTGFLNPMPPSTTNYTTMTLTPGGTQTGYLDVR